MKIVSLARMAWGALRASWWAILLGIVFIIVGWIYIVKKKERAGDNGIEPSDIIDSVIDRARDAAVDVRVERAILSATAEGERKELEAIRTISDGQERRRRLAEKLGKAL